MTHDDAPDDAVRDDHDDHDDRWNGSRSDSLIARVVDRDAGPADWDELGNLARESSAVWQDLLDALRVDASLRTGLDEQLARASRVELPGAGAHPVARIRRLPRGRGRVGWTGWAAAALLAVAWAGSSMREAAPAPAGGPVARGDGGPGAPFDELSASLQLDEAAPGGPRPRFSGDASSDVRLASDQLVSELPMQVVETRPAEDGSGYDVLYVRRLLQRARVGSVYSLGLDEQGQPAPVAVDPALLASADSL